VDNIFEVLIYVFIIISFLSSFFRKKKKEAIKKEQMQAQISDQQGMNEEVNVQASPPVQIQEPEYDILKEFEDFFKVGERKEEREIQPQRETVTGPEEIIREFKRVPEDSFHTKTASEHTFVDPWDKKQIDIAKRKESISSEVDKQATAFEKYLKIPDTSAARISHKIKERMRQPTSLKEYVIISELMGKPKALKR